jgi:RNA polymerase sigma-70 factor (ECF subfamily)
MEQLLITDEDLMRDFCAGDARAFELLYSRHEKPLYRYVRRVMGSGLSSQVDDVFQDTWIRLVDARDSWRARDDATFKTWLYTLAHHRAVDLLRKSGREVSVDDGWLESDAETPWQLWPASSAEQPEQQAFWRRAGQQLLDCLEGLPALQRAAFLLHHDDGLSLEEITQVLSAEFETVKSRLRYALSKLRICMGAYLQPLFHSETGGQS